MNLKDRLRHLAQSQTGHLNLGRTTAVCKSAKETGGVVLVHTHEFARDLQRQYGIVAKSYETNLDGLLGPFFIDHHALSKLLLKAAAKIESLEADLVLEQLKNKPPKPEEINDDDPYFKRSGAV